ncbi:carboxymuconolactone decarboxylase family protein [Mycetocola zhujimingii]|uniref:carboxymuconolactone decarboxylase family protein n=1 Tax=Mycetocola zhujimingii TaxID=2079792 RepID=UPI000D377E6D|nr:carboxymuconolactone decarboxylase family protein [Mycetocola zhujimingii]AWB86788.1 carboxymuconolactone decarboxylase [Mycetocola zhujimingii]
MTIRDEARREREIVHPTARVSSGPPLSETDPEFFALYQDFAFGETLRHVDLDRRDRLIYQLAAAIAVGAVREFRLLLGAALDVGVTAIQVKELTYQSVAYVGIARALDAIVATNEIFTERGIPLPVDGQATTTPDTRMAAGLALQKEIFGPEAIDGLYARSSPDSLHFQQFLSGNCFGDYYTRTGFDLKQRELITFALLAALGGADSQVKSHVTANFNVGNSRTDLVGVLTALVAYIGYPRTLNALAQIEAAAPAPR